MSLLLNLSPVASTDCSSFEVAVTVADNKGRVLSGLSASDFRAKWQREPAVVESLETRRCPAHIILMVDASGSMLKKHVWDTLTYLVSHVAWSIPAECSVSLVLFTNKIETFEKDRSAMQATLDSLHERAKEFKGRTAFLDAVAQTIEQVPLQAGDVILAITDGADNASKLGYREIGRRLRDSHVRFFAILPLVDYPSTPEEMRGPYELSDLAEVTGGAAMDLGVGLGTDEAKKRRTELLAQLVADQLSRYYLLRIQGAPLFEPLGKLELVVVDQAGHKRNDFQVFYPRSFNPCWTPD